MSNQSTERVFDALGDPVRRRILELLHAGPSPVGVLADRLPVGRPAVSKHLGVLSSCGLVDHRRSGTRNVYALAPGGLAVAQAWLTATWDGTLAAFAQAAEAAAEVVRLGSSPGRPYQPQTTDPVTAPTTEATP